MAESADSKVGYWQDPLWRTWRPTVAAAIAVGIVAAMTEWFALDRPATYALIALAVLLGYVAFGFWLFLKRR